MTKNGMVLKLKCTTANLHERHVAMTCTLYTMAICIYILQRHRAYASCRAMLELQPWCSNGALVLENYDGLCTSHI